MSDFTQEELAIGEHMFDLQPDSPWTAFCELREWFGSMSLERRQDLFDIVAKRRGLVLYGPLVAVPSAGHVNAEAVRAVIRKHGWNDATALALVTAYLQQADLTRAGLNSLIMSLANNSRALDLVAFLQDCAMTGTDQDYKTP